MYSRLSSLLNICLLFYSVTQTSFGVCSVSFCYDDGKGEDPVIPIFMGIL